MAIQQHRYIRNILYNLKKVFGQPITLYKFVSKTRDIESGLITQLFFSNPISKAVVFPDTAQRDFVYDLAFIAANKNFTHGAFFDKIDKGFLIDHQDLLLNTPITNNDQVTYDGNDFTIKNVEQLEEFRASALKTVRVVTAPTISEQGAVNTVTVPKQLTIGPDFITGTAAAGVTINEGDLVFQNGATIYLADQSNTLRPCIGIVTAILNGVIFHARVTVVEDITIQGSIGSDHRTIYLGTDGAMTFDCPTTGLVQQVGFATRNITGSRYEAAFNITGNIISL